MIEIKMSKRNKNKQEPTQASVVELASKIIDIDFMDKVNVFINKDQREYVKTTIQFYPEDLDKIVKFVNAIPTDQLVKTLSVFYPLPE